MAGEAAEENKTLYPAVPVVLLVQAELRLLFLHLADCQAKELSGIE